MNFNFHQPFWEKEHHWAFNWTLKHSILSQASSHQSFPFMCRHQISEPIHKITGFACASKISAPVRVIDCSVCLAIFRHHRGLREPQKVSLNLSLKLCHPFFPLFPTELIRSQLFSCSGVKFLSVRHPSPPPAPSKITHTNTALCSADYCDILIKTDLKGRSQCYHVNPHRSFTLFKQIRRGLYPFGSAKSNSFTTKGGL